MPPNEDVQQYAKIVVARFRDYFSYVNVVEILNNSDNYQDSRVSISSGAFLGSDGRNMLYVKVVEVYRLGAPLPKLEGICIELSKRINKSSIEVVIINSGFEVPASLLEIFVLQFIKDAQIRNIPPVGVDPYEELSNSNDLIRRMFKYDPDGYTKYTENGMQGVDQETVPISPIDFIQTVNQYEQMIDGQN